MSDFETLDSLLQTRASCRAFLPDPVPQEYLGDILRAAQHVPSWCNSQPWQVIACGSDETTRFATALYAHVLEAGHESDVPFPTRYEGVYRNRRSTCGWQLYDAVGVVKGDRAASAAQMRENFRLFGAPNFVLITSPKALGPYGMLDCGAYVTAVLLAAQAKGVGAVPMASVAGYAPFVRDWFDVPEDRDVICGIGLGYTDHTHPANGFRTERASLSEAVEWR